MDDKAKRQPENPFGIGSFELNHANMLLRDWFAGMALQGTIAHIGSHPDDSMQSHGGSPLMQTAAESIAESSYRYADAMLKARQ